MKHAGCILEFTDQRNEELMRTFDRVLKENPFIDLEDAYAKVAESPCSRFWVSEERAKVVLSAMEKNNSGLYDMRHHKREMFLELHRRTKSLQEKHPDDSFFDIVMMAVNSPAPRFFMSPRFVKDIIYAINKGSYRKRSRKHPFYGRHA